MFQGREAFDGCAGLVEQRGYSTVARPFGGLRWGRPLFSPLGPTHGVKSQEMFPTEHTHNRMATGHYISLRQCDVSVLIGPWFETGTNQRRSGRMVMSQHRAAQQQPLASPREYR